MRVKRKMGAQRKNKTHPRAGVRASQRVAGSKTYPSVSPRGHSKDVFLGNRCQIGPGAAGL